MRSRGAWCAIALTTLAPAALAHAQSSPPAVLVSPGAALERAVRAALEPWDVELIAIDAPSPGATAPGANAAARALAVAHDAGAVAWISAHEQGHALWVYDLASHRVTERALTTAPPFDEATAAAVGLSLKTLLRHSATAPEAERYGAPGVPQERESPTAEAEAAAAARAAPVPAEETGASEAEPSRQTVRSERAPTAPRHASVLDLELRAGLGLAGTDASPVVLRLGLGAVLWPRSGALGVGLAAASGPASRVREPRFDGRLFDLDAAFLGYARHAPASALRMAAGLGAGLHVASLDGELPQDGGEASATRVVPTLNAELHADWRVTPSFYVGARGGAALRLRTPRYRVGEDPVLELSRVGFVAALALGWALPP
jgi:hypothetical protein